MLFMQLYWAAKPFDQVDVSDKNQFSSAINDRECLRSQLKRWMEELLFQ